MRQSFIEKVLIPFDIIDYESANILDTECNLLNVSVESFLLACRGICKDSLIKIRLFIKNYIHLTKDDIMSFFNVDIIKNEIQQIKMRIEKISTLKMPRKGDIIDKYKIISVLGKGSTSVVYKAENILLQKEVAIKVLLPELLAKDPLIKEKFLKEAINNSNIQHKNIVKIFDADIRGIYSYIVMEYIEGLNLDQIVKEKGSLDQKEVVRIGVELCKVLSEASKIGLTHQDIKPDNIMIDRENKVKLADFGLPRIISKPDKTQNITDNIYSSPCYMAPESFIDPDKFTVKADMYSLGVTLYHLITGKIPFEAKSIAKIISMHLTETPIPPHYLKPNVDVRLSSIIMKLIEKEPFERYRNYDEILYDLAELKEEAYIRKVA